MTKLFLFLTISTLISLSCHSQIVFEEGYFINENNQKIDCMIKNVDWENNPTEFEFRVLPNTEIKKISIQEVQEFGINGVSKYIRAWVELDRSADNLGKLTAEKDPVFQVERLFLSVLIEGKASLLRYSEGGSLTRFFYSTGDTIKQLVYKRYIVKGDIIAQNNYFRQQLFTDLKCQDITVQDVGDLDYREKELAQLVVKYNECNNYDYVYFARKQKRDLFNLAVRPGLGSSNLSVRSAASDMYDSDVSGIDFRFGIETEFILPFNKNKWALIIEPTYQYFQSESTNEADHVTGGILITKVDYKSIGLPMGLRHSFFLKNESRIFLDLTYAWNFSLNSTIDYVRSGGTILKSFDIKSVGNLAIGAGYNYRDRLSLGIRYHVSRELLANLDWNSEYKSVALVFGCTLF